MNLFKATYSYAIGSPHERISIDVSDCLYFGSSPFQQISICLTEALGKILVLDGVLQSSENDEYRYHESLVQPAMLSHPNPQSVLIVGGADGAAAREVLRHPSVEHLVVVETDELLIDQCYNFLPEWHQGAFEDSRLELLVNDSFRFVRTCKTKFDVIIIDSGDRLVQRDSAKYLVSSEFIEAASKLLAARGVLCFQAGSVSIGKNSGFVERLKHVDGLFTYQQPYYTYVPSFWSEWGFVIASDAFDFNSLKEADIDLRIKCRRMNKGLKYVNGKTIHNMASFPKDVFSAFEGQLNVQSESEVILNNVLEFSD